MNKKPMTKLIDALSARIHFGEIMERTDQENTRFLVSRRGKPKVVILSVEDYLKNIIKGSQLLTDIQISAQKAGLDEMTLEEVNAEIASYRRAKKKS